MPNLDETKKLTEIRKLQTGALPLTLEEKTINLLIDEVAVLRANLLHMADRVLLLERTTSQGRLH